MAGKLDKAKAECAEAKLKFHASLRGPACDVKVEIERRISGKLLRG